MLIIFGAKKVTEECFFNSSIKKILALLFGKTIVVRCNDEVLVINNSLASLDKNDASITIKIKKTILFRSKKQMSLITFFRILNQKLMIYF